MGRGAGPGPERVGPSVRVLLDLRPRKTGERQGAQVAWSRILLGVAAGAVLLLVSVNLAVLSAQLVRLHREENRLLAERGLLESQSMKLGGEASQLKKRQAEREEQVRFLQEDLPVLEVLATLDALTPQGMSLESLKIQGKGLTLRGIAPGQDQVVALTHRLERAAPFRLRGASSDGDAPPGQRTPDRLLPGVHPPRVARVSPETAPGGALT